MEPSQAVQHRFGGTQPHPFIIRSLHQFPQRPYRVVASIRQLGVGADAGGDNFSYEGLLEIVLTYDMAGPDVTTLRGVFDGSYPRYDRMHNRTRILPLEAVFESRPKE